MRYVEFWLAVHYYECVWLTGIPLTEKQLPTNFYDVVRRSRINRKEAAEIAMWLQLHYEDICEKYAFIDNPVLKQDVLAVITPFKKQVMVIKEELKKALGECSENIAVGTVHTFQGGERRIIIFSTTYGAEDGCSFIDREHSLMNVAVSRAKDAFWVFGCRDCLRGKSEKIPSGLLDRYIEQHQIT